MSNEELVAQIQKGNNGAVETLWSQIRRLVHTFACRYHAATQGRGGVTVEDLEQAGFLAMVDAIPRYNPAEAAFSTYLVQYLRKHFQEASGRLYKDAKGYFMPKDALNTSISLNMHVDDEEETELLDLVEGSATNWESIEEAIWREQLRKTMDDALQQLPNEQVAVLHHRFWDRLTYEQIGNRLGCDGNKARGEESRAIRALRQPACRKRLMPFCDFDYYSGTGLGAFKSGGASIQERYVIHKEQCENVF